MTEPDYVKKLFPSDIWVISESRFRNLDLSGICRDFGAKIVKEHGISDLAWYMLNPNPITVEKKIIGCEIHYKQPLSVKIKEKIRKILPEKLQKLYKIKNILPPEVLISNSTAKTSCIHDKDLKEHFDKLYGLLMPYDAMLKRLSRLDSKTISDIKGICRGTGDNRLLLEIKRDSIAEKIRYLFDYALKNIPVILPRAFVADGLLDMKGFNFASYDPANSYRLIIFQHNGASRACVLGRNNQVQYWIENVRLINYMYLLEQTIKTDPYFYDSLNQCRKGNAKPLLLFFNRQLEIDYSKGHLPGIYKKAFKTCNVGPDERSAVVNLLKNSQLGISLKYTHKSDSGEEKLLTSISVMHDFKALEPLKEHLPQLYLEINRRAPVSEAGRFYLLDSMRGIIDE